MSLLHVQARFPSAKPVTFRQLPPDATLQLRVYDGEPEGALCFSGGKLYPKRLLGQADLALSHIEVHTSCSSLQGRLPPCLLLIDVQPVVFSYTQLPKCCAAFSYPSHTACCHVRTQNVVAICLDSYYSTGWQLPYLWQCCRQVASDCPAESFPCAGVLQLMTTPCTCLLQVGDAVSMLL